MKNGLDPKVAVVAAYKALSDQAHWAGNQASDQLESQVMEH